MPYYHFTSPNRAHIIGLRGFIAPTESNVGSAIKGMNPYGQHVGPDVVWLSDTLDLGNASHGLMYEKTLAVLEVHVVPIKWLDWLPGFRMDRRWRDLLIQAGGGKEAAEHWYVWPGNILADKFTYRKDLQVTGFIDMEDQ